jgi:hypothetical protein
MYTQQSNALAAALALPAGQQQTQAILQVFANCVQGLRTNGPVAINTGAGQQAPRAGVITSPPGVGNIRNPQAPTGNALTDYAHGVGNRPPGQYPGGTWNVNGPSAGGGGGTGGAISITGPTTVINGGDISYGDTFQTTNNTNDYRTYNNYSTTNDNSVHNNNVSNWYENQYTDNSYNDFSTTLQTTQNTYTQTVNNIEGDTYFDNTVNQGDVINQSTVINQGDVIHQGDTYMDENKTFITNDNSTLNLINYITNVVINIIQGNGRDGKDGKDAIAQAFNYNFNGLETTHKFELKVKEFNPETCSNEEKTVKGEVKVKPSGTIVRVP